MSEPYLGEVKLISFAFPPRGWAECNGQLLPINQNQALYSILGTTYGGNGVTNFALPDLRGRLPVHVGSGLVPGQSGGQAAHALTTQELPGHAHPARARSSPGTTGAPAGALWATGPGSSYAATPDTTLAASALGTTGAGQPHENRAPYLVLTFVIALQGVFPSQS